MRSTPTGRLPRKPFRAAIFTLVLFSTGASGTGNDGSFSRADDARVNYRATPIRALTGVCVALRGVAIDRGRIMTAEPVPARDSIPAYCRVTGIIPAAVRFIVYLPDRWNGRLYMHGNGGDAGEPLDHPPYHALRLNAVRHGFAAAYTDTGHQATEALADWGGDPAREADYGHRAVHLTALVAKAIAAQIYGATVAHAYFDGCSTGGRQGMMVAQRYPDDFDGILAGAPVFDLPDMLWQYRRNSLAVERTPITPARLAQLGAFIRSRFDSADGVVDGVIGDPLAVDFVPSRDLPRSPDDPDGFTREELDTLDRLYAPVLAQDREIFPRTVVGAELAGQVYTAGDRRQVRMESAWVGRVVPDDNGFLLQPLILESWFRHLAFDVDDPQRDWRVMDPARDVQGMAHMRGLLRAADPSLGEFARRGGKLILYHGWADFGVNPLRTMQYVDQVRAMSLLRAEDYLRLYLVPGMFHCSGGTNVDHFDLLTPLLDWVEAGAAPGAIAAERIEAGRVTRTRNLCPHPSIAQYRGGDPDRAQSFTCVGTTDGSR